MSKFLAIFLFPSLLWAAHPGYTGQGTTQDKLRLFEQTIAEYQLYCDGECLAPFTEKFIFDDYERTDESFYQIKTALEKVSYDQAQIWGDTILEGDYVAQGKISLDSVVAIRKANAIIGYLITYSQKAWDTATCNYDYNYPETLNECASGRITESSFVSPDFQIYFQDPNRYAEFSAE